MAKTNLRTVNGELTIGNRPYEYCTIVAAERKLSNSFTERKANTYATAKYSECSCAEPIIPLSEGNAPETACGVLMQDTEQISGNIEDVDAGLQCESFSLMPKIGNVHAGNPKYILR